MPLVDTMEAISLLRKDMWDELLQDLGTLTLWTGSPLVVVAGIPLEVWGFAVVDIEMAGEVFCSIVVVTAGDFLRTNDCTLEVGVTFCWSGSGSHAC